MAPKLADLTLRHVDPSKLLLERTDITGNVPEWFDEPQPGTFQCYGWHGGAVLTVTETKFRHQFFVVSVGVAGLLGTDEQMKLSSRQAPKDDALLKAASEEELNIFARRAVGDLFPFLRQELYSLSGRFQGVVGVMLAPTFVLAPPGETPLRTGGGAPPVDM